MPSWLKHGCKYLLRPDYRHKHQEIARIGSLPHYRQTVTDILSQPLEIADGPTFVHKYKEIFEQQIYRFRSNNQRPFIIDGGANIGLSILYFKKIYPLSQIVAFEPDEKIFSVLQRNIQKSGDGDIGNLNEMCKMIA